MIAMKNIKNLFKNDVIKKILLFFNENPQCIDTAKGISVWIACDSDIVQEMLDKLVSEGVLINHKSSSTDAYSYTNNRDIIKNIEKYIKTNISAL